MTTTTNGILRCASVRVETTDTLEEFNIAREYYHFWLGKSSVNGPCISMYSISICIYIDIYIYIYIYIPQGKCHGVVECCGIWASKCTWMDREAFALCLGEVRLPLQYSWSVSLLGNNGANFAQFPHQGFSLRLQYKETDLTWMIALHDLVYLQGEHVFLLDTHWLEVNQSDWSFHLQSHFCCLLNTALCTFWNLSAIRKQLTSNSEIFCCQASLSSLHNPDVLSKSQFLMVKSPFSPWDKSTKTIA